MKADAKDLFARAHELGGEEREAFLAEACGDDAELRLEVERLLVQAVKADSFFGDDEGATIGADAFDATYTEAEGDVVGPYTLRQQIGEGGFGTVWMAEQSEPISRMVALKVIKAGMDTKQVLARFEAERQAVAMMDHPNIAKVLDAGATTTGRPYFAMELVKGIPITEFCDQQNFDSRRRLELFRDVCAAVNHAHQKGIIHRDLKPSNIMITLAADVPVVKVIDFGIAKATQNKLTEKTLFTRFEQFLGTPVYMSPEQAAMSAIDIDTRSDIYSLGVLLYELLAGAPPFDQKSLLSAGYDEMRRIIAEDEPPKPSTRCTQTQANPATTTGSKAKKSTINPTALKGELDWIVMKAIEKDRTRRYETANAFAADIGRYLSDEPVLAAAASAAYKFKKFARRNKAAFSVAAAMVVLLLAGIAATSWQAVRATAAEKKATETLALVAVESDAKTAALEDAEASSKFLTDMFASSEPGAKTGGREVKVAAVLDRAAEKLETDTAMPPARRAKLQASLGSTYHALGLYPQAIDLKEQVRDYRMTTLGPEHPDTLTAISYLANSYSSAGRRDEALKMGEEVLALRRKVLGPEHPDTLVAMNNLAVSYSSAGRRDEALELFEEVLALRRKELGPEHPDTLSAVGNLASSYHEAGRRDEALEMDEEVLALSRKVSGPEHPDTLFKMHNLAVSYFAANRRDEALEMREEVLALRREVLGPEHPETLGAMGNLALSYHAAGRLDEAIEMLEEALTVSRKVLGPEHPDTLEAMKNLVSSYRAAGRLDEVLKLREEALALRRKALGDEHPDTLSVMTTLANTYAEAGRWDEAIEMQEEARPRVEELLAADPSDQTALELMADLVLAESAPEWTVLEPTEMKSEGGTTLEVLDDHSIFASGVNPEQETYTVTAPLDGDVPTGIRLETIPDSRLPGGGAGRGGANGIIILTEFVPELVPPSGEPALPLAIRSAWVDWAQPGYSAIERTFDGNDQSYWAVNPKFAEPHTAIYALESSRLEKQASSQLRIHVHFDHRTYRYSSLGRFRLSVTDDPRAVDLVAAQNISDPTTRLAAAYALAGQTNEAVAWFDRALKALRAASELYPDGPRGIEMRELLVKALVALGREEEAREVRRALAALPAPVSKDSPVVRSVIVAPSSEWSWLHPTDGADPKESDADFHQTFFTADFDDAQWQRGTDSEGASGGFGYGDDGFKGVDIGTPGSKELGKSAYFRHRFTTTKEHPNLELRCQRDDGLIIYLDGKEVARDNMAEGEEAYALPAASTVGGQDERTTRRIPLQDLTLPPGDHVLSISLHNTEAPSSDLRIGGITLVEVEAPEAK